MEGDVVGKVDGDWVGVEQGDEDGEGDACRPPTAPMFDSEEPDTPTAHGHNLRLHPTQRKTGTQEPLLP